LTQRFLRQRRGAIQYDILEQEVDTNAELVEALSRRAGEIDAAGIGRSNIAVVDRAERPGGPSEPSMVFNLMTSLFIGVLASAGIVFLREQLDTGIRDPADVKRVLGLPLLGSIPRVEDGDVLGELNNRWSHLYESYLAVQTNLTFATPDGAPRTMLLTSTRPNEGKTASAVALAAVFSKLGKKTLLIDADMRNSRLGDFLGMTQQDGLSNLLSSDQPVNELIYSPENHGFDLILSGRTPPNAAELLAGNRFPFLLRELAGHYDHVLIDGPPILGLADAPLIAKSTDAVIAIIEANGGSLRTIQTALARLDFAHVAILGAIVTKLDDRNAGYGYGEGYGYGYGYGKREEA
ncbi:MAG: polysaccharide biosynthesis tyrosine autokinase, partial [Sphingomonadaceae bacterium]|nr:polysaccharide biosynthesis tyrosine autokinase [Sphingomonadaceae bacterium]